MDSQSVPKIFISYSHRDPESLERLRVHLKPLNRENKIDVWVDEARINPSDDWLAKIIDGLKTTNVAILLVSADFLASDFIHKHELPLILDAWENRGLKVYWVLLSPCHIGSFDFFNQIQAVHDKSKALSMLEWHDTEAVWESLIRRLETDLKLSAASVPPEPARSPHVARNRPVKKIPPLLHYRCDRKEQEAQLDEALRRDRVSRPLVCITHGDERQCHDKFLELLTKESLREILELRSEHPDPKEFHVDLPECSRLDDFRPKLLKLLGKSVLGNATATRDELCAKFADLKRPVVVQARLNTNEWSRDRRSAVEQFLDFWGEWPDRPSKFRPLVFLLVIYQRGAGRGILAWYRRQQLRQANRRFRAHIKTFADRQASLASALVMNELRGVEQSDLENWAKHERTRKFSGGRDLLDEVRSVWDRHGHIETDRRIPMDIVARELKRLLDQGSNHRGVSS